MAVTYGFFNSVNGDRKYNADQMSEYFRGIVSQGVFQHLDSGLAVSAGTGLSVSVAAGRAIIQDRWIQNSAALNLTISAASETYGRKDAVVIRLDKSSRAISITVKTGTPAASPVAPSMTRNATTYEMALAYVNVAAGASSVTVTDKRSDSSVCGWASVAQSTSGEVDQMLNAMKTGFDGVVYSSPAAMVQGEDQKISAAVSDLKNNLILSFDGKRTFMGAGSFAQGGLDNDTELLPSQHWRVSNDAPMLFDRDIIVSVKSGFMWGYDLAGVSGSWHGWYTVPTTIPANTSVVLQISRTVTDTSEYANVDEFVSALTFEDSTSYLANKNKDKISQIENIVELDVEWTSGFYFNSEGVSITYAPFSISDYIPVNENNGLLQDIYFTVYGNTATYCVFYDSNRSIIQTQQIGSELTSSTEGIQNVAYVRLTNANDKTPVVWRSNLRNALQLESGITVPTGLVVGGISGSGEYLDITNRMRTIEPFSLPVDSRLTTQWAKYHIGFQIYENGSWQDKGWKTADISIPSNHLVRITVTRSDYSVTPLTDAEKEEIRANTKLYGQLFLMSNKYKWEDKKWVCVGDSLTGENIRTTKHYFDYIHEDTGIFTINMGVSGTGYANGDGANKQFYNRVGDVPTDADVVTIFGSLNDLASGLPLGSISDSGTTTIAGCINTTIDNLFTAFPLANLGIVTPTPWQYYNPYSDNASAKSYVQMIVDICNKRGIPCLNLYHCSGLRPWDADFRQLAYTKDNGNGTHPDETGHKIIAPRFKGFLETLLL